MWTVHWILWIIATGCLAQQPVPLMFRKFICEPETALTLTCPDSLAPSIVRAYYGKIWPLNGQLAEENDDRCFWVDRVTQSDLLVDAMQLVHCGTGEQTCIQTADWSILHVTITNNRYKGNSYYEIHFTCVPEDATIESTTSETAIKEVPPSQSFSTTIMNPDKFTHENAQTSTYPDVVESSPKPVSAGSSPKPVLAESSTRASRTSTTESRNLNNSIGDAGAFFDADPSNNYGIALGTVLIAVTLLGLLILGACMLLRSYRKRSRKHDAEEPALFNSSVYSHGTTMSRGTMSSRFSSATYTMGRAIDQAYTRAKTIVPRRRPPPPPPPPEIHDDFIPANRQNAYSEIDDNRPPPLNPEFQRGLAYSSLSNKKWETGKTFTAAPQYETPVSQEPKRATTQETTRATTQETTKRTHAYENETGPIMPEIPVMIQNNLNETNTIPKDVQVEYENNVTSPPLPYYDASKNDSEDSDDSHDYDNATEILQEFYAKGGQPGSAVNNPGYVNSSDYILAGQGSSDEGFYDNVCNVLGNTYDNASNVLGDTYDNASNVLGNTYDNASNVLGDTYDNVDRTEAQESYDNETEAVKQENKCEVKSQNGNHDVTGQNGNHDVTGQNGNHDVTGQNGNHDVTGQNGNQDVAGQNGNQDVAGQSGNHEVKGQNEKLEVKGQNEEHEVKDLNEKCESKGPNFQRVDTYAVIQKKKQSPNNEVESVQVTAPRLPTKKGKKGALKRTEADQSQAKNMSEPQLPTNNGVKKVAWKNDLHRKNDTGTNGKIETEIHSKSKTETVDEIHKSRLVEQRRVQKVKLEDQAPKTRPELPRKSSARTHLSSTTENSEATDAFEEDEGQSEEVAVPISGVVVGVDTPEETGEVQDVNEEDTDPKKKRYMDIPGARSAKSIVRDSNMSFQSVGTYVSMNGQFMEELKNGGDEQEIKNSDEVDMPDYENVARMVKVVINEDGTFNYVPLTQHLDAKTGATENTVAADFDRDTGQDLTTIGARESVIECQDNDMYVSSDTAKKLDERKATPSVMWNEYIVDNAER